MDHRDQCCKEVDKRQCESNEPDIIVHGKDTIIELDHAHNGL